MDFDQFIRENSTEYKGFIIGPGSIKKGGECMAIFHCPLGASKEDVLNEGMKIVDEIEKRDS